MDNKAYTDLADQCIEELEVLQDRFLQQYDINWYKNWFYDQATGLLTFSTGDTEINFKYLELGTFSKNTGTWKWSWDNNHTLPKVKTGISIIKDFGQKHGYNKLTDGYFESSEAEAWEFTAIATKLLNGIGAYRPVSNHLLIFIVVLEFVDNEKAQDIKDKYVSCSVHEKSRRAFVCTHINSMAKVGFEEAFDTEENMELSEEDDFQAWCNECEKIREKEGEWNDESMKFADIKLVCEKCYFDMKELNLGRR